MNRTKVKRKFPVTIVPPATKYRPLDYRQYILTQSRETNEYHLFILKNNDMSDHDAAILTGGWRYHHGEYILVFTVKRLIGENGSRRSKEQLTYLKQNLEHLIRIIIQGDSSLYKNFPWLLDTRIYLQVEDEKTPQKEKHYIGKPRNYFQNQKDEYMIIF